jgi:hypothetical protein
VAEIRSSASYVRHSAQHSRIDQEQVLRSLQHRGEFDEPDSARKIWELLETPQTVASITRALGHDADGESQRYAHQVEDVLEQLFEADLIELSPDS